MTATLKKLNVRSVSLEKDWDQVNLLREDSYSRHPLHYSKGASKVVPPKGQTIGVFWGEDELICSIRIHSLQMDPVPATLEAPVREVMAALGIENGYVLDKFVAKAGVDVETVQLAAFAACTAILFLAKQDTRGAPVNWCIALAQKSLARRYTRGYGFRALDPRAWAIPEISEQDYYMVGNNIPMFYEHPCTHPIFKKLIAEGHPDVAFSEELGCPFP